MNVIVRFQGILTLLQMQPHREVPKPTVVFLPTEVMIHKLTRTMNICWNIEILQESCHNKPLLLTDRMRPGTSGQLFCCDGVRKTLLYFGSCRTYEKKFYPHYKTSKLDNIEFRKFPRPDQYFSMTKQSIFEVKLLNFFTKLIIIGSCEFKHAAESYCETLLEKGQNLSYQVLLDTLVVFHLALKLPSFPFTVRILENRHLSVEHLCSQGKVISMI